MAVTETTTPKMFCLLALTLRCANIAAQAYTTNSCYTANNPIINVTFDSVNSNYSFTTAQEGTERRQSTDIVFRARECDCVDYRNGPYFCPVGLDNCYTYRDWQQQSPLSPPVCTTERSGLVLFAISISPGLYGLFVIVLTVLCCSRRGEIALSCCLNAVVGGYANQMYASYLLRRDPELARAMIRRWCLRRRAFVEAQRRAGVETTIELGEYDPVAPSARPASLRLRTTCYKLTPSLSGLSDENTDDDEAPCCMICFVPLSDGDRVGDLTCKHVFHSDCLKDWLKKKNSCPLCLRQDVAEAFQDNL
jgi:Ring finger domain